MKFFTNAFIQAAQVTEIVGNQVTVSTGETYTTDYVVNVGDYLIKYGPNGDLFYGLPAESFEAQYKEIT